MKSFDLSGHLAFVRCRQSVSDITSLPRKNKQSQFTNFLKAVFLLAFVMVMGVSSAWGATRYATFGTPAGNGFWNSSTKTYSWIQDTNNLMPVFTFGEEGMTGCTNIHLNFTWTGSGTYSNAFRMVFQGSTDNVLATITFGYVSEKNINPTIHENTKDIDFSAVKKISIGGASTSGSITIDPASVYLEGSGSAINCTVTFGPIVSWRGTVTARRLDNNAIINSGTQVPSGTEVKFTATANTDFKTWRWEGDVTSNQYNTQTTLTITKNTNVTYNFTKGISLNAIAYNGEGGSVVVENGSSVANTLIVNPWPGDATFKATPNAGYTLEGWYTNVNCTDKVQAVADQIEIDGNNVIYKNGYLSTDGMTINLWAKFISSGYTVTWNPGTIPPGCDAWYTIDDNTTKIKETKNVPSGSKITYHATDTGNDHKMINGWSGMNNAAHFVWAPTYTINSLSSDVTIKPDFQDCFRVFAYAENGASATVSATYHTNAHGVKFFQKAEGLTFSTTVPSGYTFKGWHNGNNIVAPYNPYNYGDYSSSTDVSDLILTAKFEQIGHPNTLTCQNGTVDLSKVVAFGDATFNGSTFTVGSYSQYGNGLRIRFSSPQNLSYAKTITINGAEFNNVPIKEGTDVRWPGKTVGQNKTVINLNNRNNANYDAVTEIELSDIQAGTYTISSIVVEFDHSVAKPQLTGNTTATMVIPVGKTLTLSADNVDNNKTFWRKYDTIDGSSSEAIPTDNTPTRNISGLETGTYYFAAERCMTCEFGQPHSATEKTWVTVEVEPAGTMPTELDRIKQPIYGANHTDMAKEYLAIANLTVGGNTVSGWPVGTYSGTNTQNTTDDNVSAETDKQKLAYVLGIHNYTVNAIDGLCISQHGRAGLVQDQTELPTRATLMFKAAGTMDFFILANNKASNGDGSNASRRHIKVWYTNDQHVDANNNRILMPFKCANSNTNNDFWFYGNRGEDNSNGLQPLKVGVRLQHLGADGTCNVFITYEDEKDDNVWIKGILVKRPDLEVTIGRTDKRRYTGEEANHANSKLTPFGENQPYKWDFSTSGFTLSGQQKTNEFDGRTYICGEYNGVQLMDHLLVYSDGLTDEKAKFNGLSSGNEHIVFTHPTQYSGTNTFNQPQSGFNLNRRSFFPILSNALKVNVTGSGWFTIKCAAPNGKVKMRVLSSTNGGNAYMNVLREFEVAKSSSGTSWSTYQVYLKAHQERNGTEGFWDGTVISQASGIDAEDTQMSLYVVFDEISGESYTGGHAQLNIHELQWLNEMPADYVFQQEEDPALLNSLQSMVSNGTTERPGLYWQAGTELVEGKKSLTPAYTDGTTHASVSYNSAYNSAGYNDRVDGQTSGYGQPSTDFGCKWNVAAKAHTIAHTEVDYAGTYGSSIDYSGFSNAYSLTSANSTTAADSHKNHEFAIPISGSFFRFMPMKNQFISAWLVPSDGAKIFVLDETGEPIPFLSGADMNGDTNKAKITQAGREHGWVHAASGMTYDETNKCFTPAANTAVRIDFAALAGKEYFVVSNDGTISLARLQATGNAWRAAVEEINAPVTLTDGGTTNASAISSAMSGTGRYASSTNSITLTRTFAKDKWASLVLPFSLNEKKFKEIFGSDAKCIHFTDLDVATNTVHLTHHFYEMIVAGRPVFICPSVDVTNPTFSDVTLQASTVTNTTTPNGFEFVASYDNATINKNDLYLNNNNEIKYLNEAKTYPGMRSFIKTPSYYDPETGTTSGSTRAVLFNYAGADLSATTGIEELIYQEFGEDSVLVTDSTSIYDINGRVVGVGRDLESLPAGIYFVNGKKFVVK